MICTEAVEHAGVQEVPDNQLGGKQYYHSHKRGARDSYEKNEGKKSDNLPPIYYNLELIEKSDGTLDWEE